MKTFRSEGGIKGAILIILALLLVGVVAYSQIPTKDGERLAKVYRMYADTLDEYPKVAEISAKALAAKEDGKVVIVDVREEKEQKVSIIAGAISAADLEAAPGKYKKKTVVFYCTLGYRSGVYAEKLRKLGWNVRNLRGGILAWAHAGNDLVDADGKLTKTVHVYGRKWNLVPTGYKGVW